MLVFPILTPSVLSLCRYDSAVLKGVRFSKEYGVASLASGSESVQKTGPQSDSPALALVWRMLRIIILYLVLYVVPHVVPYVVPYSKRGDKTVFPVFRSLYRGRGMVT